MHGTFSDTGYGFEPAPSLPPLSPTSQKALTIRVACLDTEIAADAIYYECLCQHVEEEFAHLQQKVETRRVMRELLFLRGARHE